jgi:hypothetical protein
VALHAGISIVALLIPAIVVLVAHQILRLLNSLPKSRSFDELAYGYLPLVLGCNLAHYLRLGLTEAGRILPVTLATFGYGQISAPEIVAHPAVISFLQGVTLIVAALLSLILTQKIARQPFLSLWPQHLATIGLTVMLWQLIV